MKDSETENLHEKLALGSSVGQKIFHEVLRNEGRVCMFHWENENKLSVYIKCLESFTNDHQYQNYL